MTVTRATLERASKQLGLSIEGDRALRGIGPRGVPVLISYQRTRTHRGRARYEETTTLNAFMDPALRMGLGIRPRRDATSPTAARAHAGATLDRLFAIEALDRDHAREVLAGDVGAMLDDLENNLSFVSDERVVLEAPAHLVSPESLGGMLSAGTAMAAHLVAARRRVPPPAWQRELESGWIAVATQRRLAFDVERLQMQGASGRMHAGVRVELGGHAPSTRAVGWFPAPLGVALHLRRQRMTDRLAAFLGEQDVRVGNDRFDDAFVVRGSSPERVRALITPGVVSTLLALVDRGLEVEVDDAYVSAACPGLITDASRVAAMLDGVIGAGMAMTGHVLA
ncbi:MAG: hypothetical protein IT379_24310 [Deltaproteobacteria bacterium]|nr:hypothetical protein [Deltaproteobacteria bacterium]